MNLIVTSNGVMQAGGSTYTCAIGRSGFLRDKREGDGSTPVGTFYLKKVYYRPDRLPNNLSAPETNLPVQALTSLDGWCDDPADTAYNQMVTLPFTASHEKMWRDDGLYDVVVEISHNDDPPIPGAGSAVFIHVAKPGYAPTEGCVALAKPDLLEILKSASKDSQIVIQQSAV